MSQQILNTFQLQVATANAGFTEKRSSLRGLLTALRNQIAANNCVAFSNVAAAKALCSNPNDKRLAKYATALTNLVNTWGKQAVVTPAQVVLAPRPVTPPRVPPPPPRLVSNGMNGDPAQLLDAKSGELEKVAEFASLDARTFKGKLDAIRKEDEFKKDEERCKTYGSASQAAGGQKKFSQAILKTVHDLTVQAGGAVCTTFALAAAYILTEGKRQNGKVRIEVLGCARGTATHMYVVAGRHEASTIEDRSSWGKHAYIVDPWGRATYGNSLMFKVSQVLSSGGNFAQMYFAKVGQFYDNAVPDPTAEDNKAQVDVMSIERQQNQRRAELAQKRDESSELAQALARRQKKLN